MNSYCTFGLQLRAREGLSLNKDALAVGALLRALSDPQQADFANYAASKTTQLLEDALGGNCVTVCVVTLTPDVYTSRITLQYAQLIRSIYNYPLVNEVCACTWQHTIFDACVLRLPEHFHATPLSSSHPSLPLSR